jgi:hypothetical protein
VVSQYAGIPASVERHNGGKWHRHANEKRAGVAMNGTAHGEAVGSRYAHLPLLATNPVLGAAA